MINYQFAWNVGFTRENIRQMSFVVFAVRRLKTTELIIDHCQMTAFAQKV